MTANDRIFVNILKYNLGVLVSFYRECIVNENWSTADHVLEKIQLTHKNIKEYEK